MKYSLLSILLLSVFACSVKQSESSQVDSDYIIIDLDEKQESSVPLSTYFKSVQTIILETKEECLIGHVSELQVFDGYIYILDMSISKSLFVFDTNGHFIRKIGSLGNGPGEYKQLNDFTLDPENGFIFLLDFGKNVHKYHFDGTFVKTITPELINTRINNIQFYKNKLYMSVDAFQPAPDDNMLLEVDSDNGAILSGTLPLEYNKGWGKPFSTSHSFFMSRLSDPPRYTRLFMDNIVTIGENITPYIRIKGKHLATSEDLDNLQFGSQNFEMAILQFAKIWNVCSFLENDDLIIFRYQHGFKKKNTVICNKKTGTVKLVDYLNNDLVFKNNDKNGLYRDFVFSDSKGAYEILYGKLFGDFKESIRNDEITELDKLDQLSKLENDVNPVIFYYEFK